jgi:hypothetical protein
LPTAGDLARATAGVVDELKVRNVETVAALCRLHVLSDVHRVLGTGGRLKMTNESAGWAQAYLTHRQWASMATTYSMHPLMVGELAEVDRSRMPTAVLNHIPHRNPMIVFPQPLPCLNHDSSTGELLAAYVVGDGPRGTVDTDSADREWLRLVLATRTATDLELAVVNLDTRDEWYSADEAIDRSATENARTAQRTVDSPYSPNADDNAAALRSRMLPVLDALTYVCSLGADIQPAPTSRPHGKRARRRERDPAPAALDLRVGWQLGPQLADLRRHYAEHRGEPGDGTMRPHPRRGFYAIHWTGPGRTVPRNTLRRPTYVNRDKLDGPPPTTIVPVSPA